MSSSWSIKDEQTNNTAQWTHLQYEQAILAVLLQSCNPMANLNESPNMLNFNSNTLQTLLSGLTLLQAQQDQQMQLQQQQQRLEELLQEQQLNQLRRQQQEQQLQQQQQHGRLISRLCEPEHLQNLVIAQQHHQNQQQGHQPQLHQPTSNAPSSTLLAKLNAVTSRPSAQYLSTKLDSRIIELLEALYAINDNPEPAAIEMIAKRINTTTEAISDWFDEKRLQLNPNAGPRSPPVKKRQGGRVVTFSEYQRSLLEAIFDENNYLHPQEYEELSNLIQVPSRNIKIWFKNRRSKQRLSGRVTTPGSPD